MKVAVLNREYMPLMYCDVKRAMVLVYLKKAEIVQATERVLHSVSDAFPVPAVIRLLQKITRHFIPKVTYSRKNVFTRDKHTCQYCGAKEKKLTLDHVMPVSRGGKSSWENVVTACHECNIRKGNRTPSEARMPLKIRPKKPSILLQVDWHQLFENFFLRET